MNNNCYNCLERPRIYDPKTGLLCQFCDISCRSLYIIAKNITDLSTLDPVTVAPCGIDGCRNPSQLVGSVHKSVNNVFCLEHSNQKIRENKARSSVQLIQQNIPDQGNPPLGPNPPAGLEHSSETSKSWRMGLAIIAVASLIFIAMKLRR